jgi:hypothetical protein
MLPQPCSSRSGIYVKIGNNGAAFFASRVPRHTSHARPCPPAPAHHPNFPRPRAGEAPPEEKPTGGVVLSRKTAADIGGVSGPEALGIIRQAMGPFNWALYTPNDKEGGLDLINA